MKWIKKGLVYGPSKKWWSKTHCYCPIPYLMEDVIRVYFASWDEDRVGRIGFVDLDIKDPSRIVNESKEPVFDIGQPGTFDHNGVGPSCVMNVGDELYLYYFGFQKTPMEAITLAFCGLAISKDNGKTFSRHSNVPILERTQKDSFLRSSISIIKEKDYYAGWYTSSLCGWIRVYSNKLHSKSDYPVYTIRYVESIDGINWSGITKECIDLKGDEFSLGKPWVMREGGKYKMWYSYQSARQSYRIGYAESECVTGFKRMDDKVGITVSDSGWDSEMICFPTIIDTINGKYMFYNGNRHGIDGFGYAELK